MCNCGYVMCTFLSVSRLHFSSSLNQTNSQNNQTSHLCIFFLYATLFACCYFYDAFLFFAEFQLDIYQPNYFQTFFIFNVCICLFVQLWQWLWLYWCLFYIFRESIRMCVCVYLYIVFLFLACRDMCLCRCIFVSMEVQKTSNTLFASY